MPVRFTRTVKLVFEVLKSTPPPFSEISIYLRVKEIITQGLTSTMNATGPRNPQIAYPSVDNQQLKIRNLRIKHL